MNSVIGKEQMMKAQATHKLIQLSAILGAAGSLAATVGHMGWSDAKMKRNVSLVEGGLAKLRRLENR